MAHVRDLGPRRAEALRVLRGLRREPPAKLLEMIRDAQPLNEGALVEVEYFGDALEKVEANVVLSRVAE